MLTALFISRSREAEKGCAALNISSFVFRDYYPPCMHSHKSVQTTYISHSNLRKLRSIFGLLRPHVAWKSMNAKEEHNCKLSSRYVVRHKRFAESKEILYMTIYDKSIDRHSSGPHLAVKSRCTSALMTSGSVSTACRTRAATALASSTVRAGPTCSTRRERAVSIGTTSMRDCQWAGCHRPC
jgi:hypothetical protein